MTIKTFKNNEEILALLKERNGDRYIDLDGLSIICEFDMDLQNIAILNAGNIYTENIKAGDIKAESIDAESIDATDILYQTLCLASGGINCTSLKGTTESSKLICLGGGITIKAKN